MKTQRIYTMSLTKIFLFMLIVASCEQLVDTLTIDGERVVNNSTQLNDRLTLHTDTIHIENLSGTSARTKKTFELILTSALASPDHAGQKLQATTIVDYEGGFLTTYNYQGAPFHGAIDYVGSELRVRSQVIYKFADINAVSFDKNDIFVVGAKDFSDQPAFIDQIELKSNSFSIDNVKTTLLGGYAANSTAKISEGILVTTGNDMNNGGGLYLLNEKLEIVKYIPLHDARWVKVDGNSAYVAQGTPGAISVVDLKTMSITSQYAFTGANEPEAKTTLDIADGMLFIAGGANGVTVLDAKSGKLLHTIVFEGLSTTNAVSAEKGMLFISNGEAGAYVAKYDVKNINEAPEVIGKLLFDDNESVNHILYRANKLYVATGLGGTKVVDLINL